MEPSGFKRFLSSVWFLILVGVIIVGAGVGAAYLLVGRKARVAGTSVSPEAVVTDKQVGLTNTEDFPDSATGVIEKGGIEGEGTHKLIREGGPDQTAYLVSSVVDLDQFIGKKVEVWGQTIDAAHAGWLMDVGLVKILE